MLEADIPRLRDALAADGEFRRAARQWSGSFAFADEDSHLRIEVRAGELNGVAARSGTADAEVVFSGPEADWAKVFAEMPPPYYQDLIGGAVGRHGFRVSGDLSAMAAHYAAIQRAVAVIGAVMREGARA